MRPGGTVDNLTFTQSVCTQYFTAAERRQATRHATPYFTSDMAAILRQTDVKKFPRKLDAKQFSASHQTKQPRRER